MLYMGRYRCGYTPEGGQLWGFLRTRLHLPQFPKFISKDQHIVRRVLAVSLPEGSILCNL